MGREFDGLVEHLLGGGVPLPEAIEILERSMIAAALNRNGGNQSAASKQLAIHRNTLQRKMLEYGLGKERPRGRKPLSREVRSRRRRAGAA
jgi:Fis family transcriptional regulator, factor for inversion stimulation protein